MTRVILIGYALVLVYGSLFPLSGWVSPELAPWRQFFSPGRLSRTDLLVNLLIYVPFGWLVARSLGARRRALWSAALAGSLLSLSMEYLQAFLPGRVPSIYDWIPNSLGTIVGALIPGHVGDLGLRRFIEDGRVAKLGAVVVGVWSAGQLFPYVPSPDVGNLRAGLRPVWHVLRGSLAFAPGRGASYTFAIFGLCVVLWTVLRPEFRRRVFVGLFFGAVLIAKVPILRQQLTLEAALGAALGVALFWVLPSRPALAFAAIAGSVLIDQFRSTGVNLSPMSWIPFRTHLVHDLTGIEDILDSTWAFLAFSFFAIRWRPEKRVAVAGASIVFVSMFALEWAQTFVPGRSPDITDVVLATAAWTLPWIRLIESPPLSR